MSVETKRPIRSANVVVASVSIMLLLMLLAPSLADSTADARRNACLNKMKEISLALANFEAARGCFPGASTAAITGKPGHAEDSKYPAGYSWLALSLPYMELAPLYNQMRDSSEKLTKSPFSDSVRVGDDGTGNLVATERVDAFLCPGFSGKPFVDVDKSDYKSQPTAGGAPAITNYFASSSTHLIPRDRGWYLGETADAAIQGNGALPLFSAKILENGWTKVRGATHAGISRDGTSFTAMFSEGREQAYAAWIDGQVAWTVAAWPGNPDLPELIPDPSKPETYPVLGWKNPHENTVGIAKQRHGAPPAEAGVYLPADRWTGSKDRTFGRSGNHPGVIGHSFGDAHSKFIDEAIDPAVYLHLTTRNGSEVIPDTRRSEP
jgi:hypothetical protein